jgi:archaemetzincin
MTSLFWTDLLCPARRFVAMAAVAAWAVAAARGCGAADEPKKRVALPAPYARLLPLHTPLGSPRPGDWLAQHPEEDQSYAQYVRSRPVRPDKKRRILYAQPLGDMPKTQRSIVEHTAEYMEAYFGLRVRMRETLSLSAVPAEARRVHPLWKDRQILSTYVLENVLAPRLPDDAVAYIAFTTSDLWPGEGWNFVFGQASLGRRVGVWSLYRYGDPDADKNSHQTVLRRTIQIGTHETGHMFSLPHCTVFACNMCGSNSMPESDRFPLWLCPQCLAKLCYATGMKPEQHYSRLIVCCKRLGLATEEKFYEKSLAVLRGETAAE